MAALAPSRATFCDFSLQWPLRAANCSFGPHKPGLGWGSLQNHLQNMVPYLRDIPISHLGRCLCFEGTLSGVSKLGPLVLPFYPFFWEGFPHYNGLQKKKVGYPHSILAMNFNKEPFGGHHSHGDSCPPITLRWFPIKIHGLCWRTSGSGLHRGEATVFGGSHSF